MNCPICNNKMPFGLQIHMAAAHGSEAVRKQLRSASTDGKEIAKKPGGQGRGRGRGRGGRRRRGGSNRNPGQSSRQGNRR